MQYVGRPGGNLYGDAVEVFKLLMTQTGSIPSVARVEEAMGLELDGLSRFFASEGELLRAMAQGAWMRLHDQCIRTMAGATDSDPISQFELLANIYMDWAHLHANEFRIISAMPDAEFRENDDLMRYETAIHQLMLKMLTRARDQGLLDPDENLQLLVATAHTLAYGVISKMLLGDLRRWVPDMPEREIAQKMLHTFIRKVLRPSKAAVIA